MIAALIPGIIGLVSKFVDKAVPDKDEANRLKAAFASEAQALAKSELEGSVQIIVAEAQGGSWLQKAWRPLTMLTFVVMIVMWWLGFTPENALITEALVDKFFSIVQIGLGGYIAGRSAEKVAKAWKEQ